MLCLDPWIESQRSTLQNLVRGAHQFFDSNPREISTCQHTHCHN